MNNEIVDVKRVDFREDEERFYLNDQLFSGFCKLNYRNGATKRIFQVQEGKIWGICREYEESGKLSLITAFDEEKHGYQLEYFRTGENFSTFFRGNLIENISVTMKSGATEKFRTSPEQIKIYEEFIKKNMSSSDAEDSIVKFYHLQEKLSHDVIIKDSFGEVQYVAGADVAYSELENRMVGAIVVLDAKTLSVVDEAIHEMEITFPYIPGLFSFREVPPLIQAYQKLNIKPDLIICDGHGIAHPKGIGVASHLGIMLNVPTVGCAKNKLIGSFDDVGNERGDYTPLTIGDNVIGRVLRTQDGIKPMFVSIGHKISLNTASNWILKLCPLYRQPETTRKADALVNRVLKARTEVGYPEE